MCIVNWLDLVTFHIIEELVHTLKGPLLVFSRLRLAQILLWMCLSRVIKRCIRRSIWWIVACKACRMVRTMWKMLGVMEITISISSCGSRSQSYVVNGNVSLSLQLLRTKNLAKLTINARGCTVGVVVAVTLHGDQHVNINKFVEIYLL